MNIIEKLSTYTPQSTEPSTIETEKSLSTLRTAIRSEKSAVPENKNTLPWFSKYRTLLTSAAVVILLVSIVASTQLSNPTQVSALEKLTKTAAAQPVPEKGIIYLETQTYYKENKQKPEESLFKSWHAPDGQTIDEQIELPSNALTNRETYQAFPKGGKPFVAFDTTDWPRTDAWLRQKSKESNDENFDPNTGKAPKYTAGDYLAFLEALIRQELDGSVIMSPSMRSVVIDSISKIEGAKIKTDIKDPIGRDAIAIVIPTEGWGEPSTYTMYFDFKTSRLLAIKDEGPAFDDDDKLDGRYVSWTAYRESKIVNTFGSGDLTPIGRQAFSNLDSQLEAQPGTTTVTSTIPMTAISSSKN